MDIVDRADWGARPPKTTPQQITTPTPELWLHHTASSDGEAARVRAIQRYHQDVKGWNDIAYSYLVSGGGTVYEGRGAGVSGAHTKNHNSISHAICVLGHYDKTQPTEASLASVVELLQHGHAQGWWPDQLTGGHRDVGSTSCPGDNLYPKIPEINTRAEDTMTPEQLQEGLIEFFSTSALPAGAVWGALVGKGDNRETLSSVLVQARNYSRSDFLNGDAGISPTELAVAIADAVEEAGIASQLANELAARLAS